MIGNFIRNVCIIHTTCIEYKTLSRCLPRSQMDKSRYSLNRSNNQVFLPDSLDTYIQQYEKLEAEKRQIEEKQQNIQTQLPIAMSTQYGRLLSSLQLQNMTSIMPIISYKLELQRPFGSADIVKELNTQTRVDSNRFVLAAVYEMFMENDLDDACAQLDTLTQQFKQDLEEYYKYQEELQAHYKTAISQDNLRGYSLPNIQDTLLVHFNSQQDIYERLMLVKEVLDDAFKMPSDNSGVLQQLQLLFTGLINEYKELNLTDELVEAIASVNLQPTNIEVSEHLNIFRTIRDLLLIVYGLNYAVSDNEDDRALTLQSLTRYQNFDAENFTSMCLIVRDGLGTIQNNLHKLDVNRHKKIQQKCQQLDSLGQEVERKIEEIQKKLAQISDICSEKKKHGFITTVHEVLSAQKEVKKRSYEISVLRKTLDDVDTDSLLSQELIQELNEQISSKNTQLLTAQQSIKVLHPAFQNNVQALKGLNEAEVFNLINAFFSQDTLEVFSLIVKPQ